MLRIQEPVQNTDTAPLYGGIKTPSAARQHLETKSKELARQKIKDIESAGSEFNEQSVKS